MANAFRSLFKILPFTPKDGAGVKKGSSGGNSGPGEGDSIVSEVWLYPDSDELSKQTALKARKIDQPVFQIGRRVSDSINYGYKNPPDMLIFEKAPFTLSKLHCQIELDGDKVVLRDLGSRLGTRLGKKRLRSNFRESSALVVPKGTHSLILGPREGPFRFRLVVT